MKFISYLTPEGVATYGVLRDNRVVDLGSERPRYPTLKDFLASPEFIGGSVAATGRVSDLSAIAFLPVIPNPGKILCVGLNYREHVQETGRTESEKPTIFLRTPISQTAHNAPLVKPSISNRFDYEGELAVIIGKPGRAIPAAQALDHIAGYACYNDGSVRDWQRHTTQWTPGKNFDQTGSFGPWLATGDAIGERGQTWLTTRLNGQTVQRANLAQMIFSIEDLIVYISTFTKLETGDVIVTGTPGGVGDRRSPPLYMFPGDKVEVEIDGVGLLANTIGSDA